MKEKETSKLYNSITNVDNQFIEEAQTKTKKKNGWLKWAAMAACLCLMFVGVLSISDWKNVPQGNQETTEQRYKETPEQVYTLPQAEKMSVELVEWGGDHFKAIVVDAENNSIFPANAELSVVFDYDTEILLDNGTLIVFNPDEPNTEIIGWEVGTVVYVEFLNYVEYHEGNHFYNQLFASHVEAENK